MRTLRRIIIATLLASLSLTGVLAFNTFAARSVQVTPETAISVEPRDGFEERLAGAIRFKTVSNVDMASADLQAFRDLHGYLAQHYPHAHEAMVREVVEPCSLLYRWKGSGEQAPVLLMSHMDVVPVEEEHLEAWTHPPFAGVIADSHIWGRGALDDKVGVLGILEAADVMAESGWSPARDIYIAFGCDEEVGGTEGAKSLASKLASRDVHFSWVLDEGHVITRGIFPGIERPVAFVGLAEKGFLTVNLVVEAEGGHSSMPPEETAVSILAGAVARVQDSPMDPHVNPAVAHMFDTLAAEGTFTNRIVFSNLWLTEPIVTRMLSRKKTTNATVRTTTASTVFHAGVQENVLPKRAEAKINFRILPGDSIASVVEHVREVVDDPRIKISVPEKGFNSNPSPVSDADGHGFKTIEKAIRSGFGEEYLVSPSLTIAGTDSRHFVSIADDVYRFLPVELGPEDTRRIHGIDERISTENYAAAIRYYSSLLHEAGR